MLQVKPKTLIDIFLIVIIGFLFRIAYISYNPCLHVTLDSHGYYDIGREILLTPSVKTIINPYRTPVYPVFINTVMKSSGHFGAPVTMPDCQTGMEAIGFIQTAANLMGMVVFYLIALRLCKKRGVALAITLIQVTAINVVAWERALQTEALAIPISIGIVAAALWTLSSPTWKRLFSVTALLAIGIVLRPSFLLYPIIIFPYIAWYHKTLPVVVRSLVSVSGIIILVLGISYANDVNWGYWGIQHSTDINLLARELQFRLPIDAARAIHPLYESAKAWEKIPANTNVFLFISAYNIDVFSASGLRTLKAFNSTVIAHSPFSYATRAIRDIPGSLLYTDDDAIPKPTSPILLASYYIFRASEYLFILAIPFMLIGWIRLLGKVSRQEASVTLLGSIAFAQVVLAAFVGDGMSYARFYAPVQPILFLYIAYWIVKLVNKMIAASRH